MRRLSGKIDFMIFMVYQTQLNQPKIKVSSKDVSSKKAEHILGCLAGYLVHGLVHPSNE